VLGVPLIMVPDKWNDGILTYLQRYPMNTIGLSLNFSEMRLTLELYISKSTRILPTSNL
jgi:hypothetical protein